DIVRSGTDPKSLAAQIERRLPDAQMIAGSHDGNRLRMRPAVVLRAPEKIKDAHRHRKVGLLGHALEKTVKHGGFHIGIYMHPTRCAKGLFHGVLRADDEKIDHVTWIAGLVCNAARNS